nr:uncharacterized protein LOC105850181 isoform X1 [Hydra vulgaris]
MYLLIVIISVTFALVTCQYYNITILERSFGEIICPIQTYIKIGTATYGPIPTDCKNCLNQNCPKSITGFVQNLCDGNNNCIVQSNNDLYGDPCFGTTKYANIFYYCYSNAFWTSWNTWSSCNVSYGYGFYNRTRMCNSTNAQEQCSGNSTEVAMCFVNHTYAAFWTAWSAWSSCNVSYDYGFFNRTRMCNSSNAIEKCFGNSTEVAVCFVNHTYAAFWTAWSAWSSCNVSYDYGFFNRTRMCNSSNAIEKCFGNSIEVAVCFVNHTYAAFWTAWSAWSSCNVSYGYGFFNRTRMCNSSNAIEQCFGNSTEVQECFVTKTHAGSMLNISFTATIQRNIVMMSIKMYPTYNIISITYIEFEIFLPVFLSVLTYNVGQHLVRTNTNQLKFSFNGSLFKLDIFNYSFIAFFNDSTCPISGLFTLEVPLKISFQVDSQNIITLTKTFQKVVECFNIPKLPIFPDILKESYGCGIYWDAGNQHIYVCMNQYTQSTKSACYYSNNDGFLWSELDIIIGSVLGHHSVTKEFYAIHRNRKTYMMFHSIYKKWLAVSNQDYDNNASRFIDSVWRKNLEDESEQIYTFGLNQWLGNSQGLFFRKLGNDSWIQRVRWKR